MCYVTLGTAIHPVCPRIDSPGRCKAYGYKQINNAEKKFNELQDNVKKLGCWFDRLTSGGVPARGSVSIYTVPFRPTRIVIVIRASSRGPPLGLTWSSIFRARPGQVNFCI